MGRQKRIWTIPNLLSAFRLALVPVIAWLYCGAQNYPLTAAVLVLSGVTDIIDGFVARRFDMVSDLGKVLDPVADKLTQCVTLVCLMRRFVPLRWLFALMAVKEIANAIIGLRAVKHTGKVYSAKWHGKLTTVLIYATILTHIIWYDLPPEASAALAAASGVMAVISFALYTTGNVKQIAGHQEQDHSK